MERCAGVALHPDSISVVVAGVASSGEPSAQACVPATLVLAPGTGAVVGAQAQRYIQAGVGAVFCDFAERVGDPVPVVGSDGSARLGADLVAMTIDGVLRTCLGGARLSHLALAHPAEWGTYEVSVMRSALTCTVAEAVPTLLVSSPVAIVMAAVAAGLMSFSETTIVADIGATSTDVTLVRGGRGQVGQLEASTRTGELATGELDHALARYVLDQVRAQLPVADLHHPANRVFVEDVVTRCRAAREMLSRGASTVVEVALPVGTVPVRVGREEFDSLAGAHLRRGLSAFVEFIDHATAICGDTIAAIVLTGEPAGTALLARLLAPQCSPRLLIPARPEWVSATGANLVATHRLPRPRAKPAAPVQRARPLQQAQPQALPGAPAQPAAAARARRRERRWTLTVGALQVTATLVVGPPARAKGHGDGEPASGYRTTASPRWPRPQLNTGL